MNDRPSHPLVFERQRSRLAVVGGLLLCLSALAAGPALARQAAGPTNMDVYRTLAHRCLAAVPDTIRAFVLAPSERMPYLSSALITAWQDEGRTLYVADTLGPGRRLPVLTYAVDDARLAYASASRRRLTRTAVLALRYTLTAPDGRLLRADGCRETFEDTVPRAVHESLATPAFPETQAALPAAGWARRYLEPAVLVAATAVGAFLFFSLRSRRSTSE